MMEGFVGIFWGIPHAGQTWDILVDRSSLADAEPYGDFLTHARGHFEVWSYWQTLNAAARTGRKVPPSVCLHEYEEFPRGRIVYHVPTNQFILYADRRLQRPNTLQQIASLFAITDGRYAVRSDAHYRTS